MNINGYRGQNCCCYFHPKQTTIGVCPLCLNERLLVLAAKRAGYGSSNSRTGNKFIKQTTVTIQKIFAFGSFFNRLELRHCKSDNYDHNRASTSQEDFGDSFISIKFEENGAASWEKNGNMSWNHHCMIPNEDYSSNYNLETKTVIEHGKPHCSLRWQKRIGHLFQLFSWKRSTSKGSVCHVSSKGMEGVKVRKGWTRTLTKRK
ncbi:RNA polymerase sigma factor RpoD like [Quillaja saponaria]|uniref:RNA polymerase sigma factor RpoD like n=1 Tax=Quillaja saponaria TaxID=32244 RepID=A0AAD7LJK1_QUISA|nr:RNA polymerase sigma factor RpoD like [Quillaja saponaria]